MRAPPFVYAASVVAPDQELAVRGRMTLDLEQLNPKKSNQLHITVISRHSCLAELSRATLRRVPAAPREQAS
jgi:hypothetical protein